MSHFVAFERADDSWVLIRLCRHLHGRLGQRLSGVSMFRDTDGTILMLLTLQCHQQIFRTQLPLRGLTQHAGVIRCRPSRECYAFFEPRCKC